MHRWLALPAVLLLAAPFARPAGPPPDTYSACMARAGNNVVQRGACSQAEFKNQDDRLNKAYQQVMQQLANDPAAKTRLRDEERSWLKKRDYDCKINGDTVDMACMIDRTKTRADELEAKVKF